MTLDTEKWLRLPISNSRHTQPEEVYKIPQKYLFHEKFIRAERFFPKDLFLKYAMRLNWTQEKLDGEVEKGNLIPAMAYTTDSRDFVKIGFMFTEPTEDYIKFLGQVAKD